MDFRRCIGLDQAPTLPVGGPEMLRYILIYGLIAGAGVGVPLSILTLTMSGQAMMQYGMLVGYLTMLIGLSAIFVAVKRHRDVELGGVIRFWPALMLGLGISFVAGVIYVITWDVSCAIAHADFAGAYARAMIAEQQAKGVSGAALERFRAEMEQFKIQYANPLYRWPMTFAEIFPVGVIVSLVSAGLLRNSRFMPLSQPVSGYRGQDGSLEKTF
jgi:hypothetical protein